MKTSKLLLIQSTLKCPKNQFNKFGNYAYRSCEDILEAVKPLLYDTQTTLTVSDEVVAVWDRIYIKATATLKDAETWEVIETSTAYAREDESQKWMSVSQISGSASSYSRKYCLAWLFLLDSNDWVDDDKLNTHGKEKKEKSESKSNPQWRFQKATTNKEFMQKCMDEDNYIRTIKGKYEVDDIVEWQLREAYRNLMWQNEKPDDLPFE